LTIGAIAGPWRAACASASVAVMLVAAVGWIDDHRGLSARSRVLVHALAVVVLYYPLFPFLVFLASAPMAWSANAQPADMPLENQVALSLGAIVFLIANVWFINLHNFMDGIDGLLASQAIFVFCALSTLVAADGASILWLCAAAVLGFLPFNFPRARIFMGDVGSGTLGLLIAAAVVLQALSLRGSAFSGLIACSAFVADATCTLLSRMLRGRRWYSAHREHLYQWLARCGFSHARVVALYMGWNLGVVVPVLYVVNRGEASRSAGFMGILAVYALALAVWIAGKRWCLLWVRAKGQGLRAKG
jgi:UDP-N-acetylmuramyl pentapeptide phosphotransferase/UDP-N-acetylglucosamine-1-phosphate transferase